MSKGQLFINGKDAYTQWSITMDSTSLSSLLTPPPLKAYIENNSRTDDGRQYLSLGTVDARELSLNLNLTANNEEEFFQRYNSFCTELRNGELRISTKYQPEVVYNCLYVSCTQFTQFMRGIAKFTLKLREPDPTNRR